MNCKMFSINNLLLNLDKKLDEKNNLNEFLKKAESFSGIERKKIVLGGGGLLAALVIIGYGAQFICNVVGFAYPAYASILAIETKEKEDDTIWLTYWVVFAAFNLAEFFSDFIVHLIPFYWMLKCIFLIWCFIPIRMNGSRVIYYNLIRPLVVSNEEKVENSPNHTEDQHEHEHES